MLGFVTRPVRMVLGVAEEEIAAPLQETRDIEGHILETAEAIRHATISIEQHVAVIETLADSVAPLGASVDRLTDTMQALVQLLAPMASAEREVQHAEHFFSRHRHKERPADPDSQS